MNYEILCKKGSCFETSSARAKMETLFDKSNLADQIEKDLMRQLMV